MKYFNHNGNPLFYSHSHDHNNHNVVEDEEQQETVVSPPASHVWGGVMALTSLGERETNEPQPTTNLPKTNLLCNFNSHRNSAHKSHILRSHEEVYSISGWDGNDRIPFLSLSLIRLFHPIWGNISVVNPLLHEAISRLAEDLNLWTNNRLRRKLNANLPYWLLFTVSYFPSSVE